MARHITPDDLSDDALVIRFSPAQAPALLQKAELQYRYRGLYVVSVYASDSQ